MKSLQTEEEILAEANSIPRPIKVPSVVIGYFGDLIKQIAHIKIIKIINMIKINDSVLECSSSHKDPKDTASVHNPT